MLVSSIRHVAFGTTRTERSWSRVIERFNRWRGANFAAPAGYDCPVTVALRWRVMGCIAASALLLAWLMHHAGMAIDPLAAGNLPYCVAGTLAMGLGIGLRGARTPLQRTVRDTAEYFGLFTLIGLLGAVASYPEAAASRGFVDAELARIDAALGFDWVAMYRLVAAHPVLQVTGRLAYETIYFTPVAILGAFAVEGRRDRAQAMLAVFWLAALLTLVLFWFMPAIGPLGYLWHGPVPYMPLSELWQPQLFPVLRDHAMRDVDLGGLVGLVSAPSFHTAAALLYIACAWPMPRLRWPVLGVNLAMLLATPVEGTHYLADMLIGALVAGASWWVVALVTARRGVTAPGDLRLVAQR